MLHKKIVRGYSCRDSERVFDVISHNGFSTRDDDGNSPVDFLHKHARIQTTKFFIDAQNTLSHNRRKKGFADSKGFAAFAFCAGWPIYSKTRSPGGQKNNVTAQICRCEPLE